MRTRSLARAKNRQRSYVDAKTLLLSGDAVRSGQERKKKTEREKGRTRENEGTERDRGEGMYRDRTGTGWFRMEERLKVKRNRGENIKGSSLLRPNLSIFGYKMLSLAAKEFLGLYEMYQLIHFFVMALIISPDC